MSTGSVAQQAAAAISHSTDHPGMGHVDWPDEFDALDIATACLAVFGEALDAHKFGSTDTASFCSCGDWETNNPVSPVDLWQTHVRKALGLS